MSRSTVCPPSDRLGQLLVGDLPALAEAEVAEHLSDCAVCQRRLEEQAVGGDIDPEQVRRLNQDDRPHRGSAYWPALSKLNNADSALTAAEPTGPGDTDDASFLSFLLPAERAGAIGKFAHFDVMRVIGRGGMGIVFEAIDPCLERQVAVKVLDPKLAKDEIARQRFLREARAAASVTHENVVIIHSVDEHDGIPYLVMQYVPGESLQEQLDQGRPGIPEAVAVGRQVAAGLAAAHARGLIHRDVKPANILITHDECLHCTEESNPVAMSSMHRVKLTDFGLARATEDVKLTQTGFVPGTPQYMAPEQARGEQLDARSDLFSLGGVLYALCTGRVPFQGSTPYLVLRQVTEEMPPPVRTINPDVPDWLAAIIERLLAKDPKDRIQTAAEVANLLFEGEARLLFCPIHGVKPPSGLARVTAPVRRRIGTLPCVGLLLAGFIAGAGAATIGWLTTGSNRPNSPVAPASSAPLRQFDGRSGAVWSVAYTPDGGTLIMATEDGTVRLYDAATGEIRGSLTGHRGPVWAIAVKADGSTMATAGDDGTVRLWELPSRRSLGSVKLSGSVRSVQFTKDGSKFVTGGRDGTVIVWDALTLDETTIANPGHTGIVMSAVVSADGMTIASGGSDKVLKIWNGRTGEERLSLSGHAGPVYGLALSPDGVTLASGGWDHTIRLWNVRTGEPIGELTGHAEDVWSVAFNSDGSRLVSAGQDKTVRVWNVATRQEVACFAGPIGVVHTATFTPDGQSVVAGGRDGKVTLWALP